MFDTDHCVHRTSHLHYGVFQASVLETTLDTQDRGVPRELICHIIYSFSYLSFEPKYQKRLRWIKVLSDSS